ncbi:hypothetical protein LX32DRAFT_441596 [Colletotrichum zoysiae]|uniref:Uncharacterized protein n=1 Tax=Colletotrichum zoysiae TaxID=1216348 RepID=A0AAD9HUJ0_9PEZI|nr:hypothetical protein LX32DRAFT_441596 [Colletotrichum zoysiae]
MQCYPADQPEDPTQPFALHETFPSFTVENPCRSPSINGTRHGQPRARARKGPEIGIYTYRTVMALHGRSLIHTRDFEQYYVGRVHQFPCPFFSNLSRSKRARSCSFPFPS